MQRSQLEVFNAMPFLFWATSDEGLYAWGNRAINEFAKQDVVGKIDDELPWADNAEALRADDREMLGTGEPIFRHEVFDRSKKGKATLSVCKFLGDLDGTKCMMGVSFVIE